MSVWSTDFKIEADGFCDLVDITDRVRACVRESGLRDGIACVAMVGSTAGVSTIEYEPGLKRDVPELMEALIPSNRSYAHDDTWHDGNGFSHLRSFLVKTSHTVPFRDGDLVLGTWQQVVVANFDNRRRSRRVAIQLVGE